MRGAGEYTERVDLLEPTIERSQGLRAQTVVYNVKAAGVRARVIFVRGVSAITQTEAWQNRTINVILRLIGKRAQRAADGATIPATGTEAIDENWRIRWEGRTYQIDSLNKDRRNGEVVMVANSTDEGRDCDDEEITD